MTKADLVLLLQFNDWARGRMLEAVAAAALTPEKFTAPLGNSFSSVRDTVVHIYSAEWVWHSRCQGHSPTAPLAAGDFPDLPTIEAAWLDVAGKWRTFVEALGEDQHLQEIDYRLMNGQTSRSAIWQIVQHVVNHSTYHRGQVMTLLRQLGAKAVSTDLIAFHRERRMNG